MQMIWIKTGVDIMPKYLYHVIKSKTKTGNIKYAIRKCTLDSYNLRLKTHADDGMYFDTLDKAIEVRDRLIAAGNGTEERKTGWVSLRLMGTEADCFDIIEALQSNFLVMGVSKPYENHQGKDVRVYCKLYRNGSGGEA